jgi:hypothetical protein
MNISNLTGLAKVGAITFAGAFAGALTLTTVPTTLDGWKALMMPALAAAIAAELVYIRAQAAAALAGQGLTTLPSIVANDVAEVPKLAAPPRVPPLLALLLVVVLGAAIAGCTPAQVTAFDSVIAQGQAALVPAENLACLGATELDSSGATAICTAIDIAGNAIGTVFTVVENAPSVVALLAKTAPKTPAVSAALLGAKAALKAKGPRASLSGGGWL